MPRPREFDEQEVVARATALFRRLGYHATSVRDLGGALQLTPSSLYRTFGDKHTLFLRALDHYRATDSAEAEARLNDTGPCRDVLRAWLQWLVTGDDQHTGLGCFVVNTTTELGTTDPEVRRRTEAAFDVTRQAIAAVLRRGCRDGELAADLDVDAATELLFTTVLGLRVRERAGHDPARLAGTIDAAIDALGPIPDRGDSPGT
ncbi:TetR/AcrR family transcriptional regulator [Prauserella muralis]|uniref:TetR family transcriptional regulator n=1 Tax=Prauserella muralis TaxID=588067 RepID=A0A2V4B6S5_9PSEU|nr:TetR/AcrR family transcriptional regulator [Prauserella muralis]PXY30917.1 TetR family transcriptional regulator [Prauserella muralis]TWE14833.1 TetR family transcriptional regulator [Prauserella muralis]